VSVSVYPVKLGRPGVGEAGGLDGAPPPPVLPPPGWLASAPPTDANPNDTAVAAIAATTPAKRRFRMGFFLPSTIKTRVLRSKELANIAGVSKTTYVLATPRCLDWRRELQRTGANNDSSGSQDPCRRPSGRHRRDYRCLRLPVVGGLVFVGNITQHGGAAAAPPARHSTRRAPWCTWRG
jgi:hypothetical protein